MMLLSKTCDYGVRAALYLASQKDVKYVPIREISNNLNISFHFLTKILQKLTQQNIIRSFKGRNGGVTLARPADTINLMEIILAIEEPDFFQKCLLGLEHCFDEEPCPIHDEWNVIRKSIHAIFEHTTLAKLSEKIHQDGTRLSDHHNKDGNRLA